MNNNNDDPFDIPNLGDISEEEIIARLRAAEQNQRPQEARGVRLEDFVAYMQSHDYIFLPPGIDHSIANTGLVDLVFLVVTSPVTDDAK